MNRRERRKREKRRYDAARADGARASVGIRATDHCSYVEVYASRCRAFTDQRKGMFFECAPQDFASEFEHFLAGLGLRVADFINFVPYADGRAITGSTAPGDATFGRTMFLRDATPVIVLPDRLPATGRSTELSHAAKLMLLLHELGHVKDFDEGKNFDRRLESYDYVAAEAYAHKYVCSELLRGRYRTSLHLYLEMLADHASCDSEYGKRAAIQVVHSDLFSKCKKLTTLVFG